MLLHWPLQRHGGGGYSGVSIVGKRTTMDLNESFLVGFQIIGFCVQLGAHRRELLYLGCQIVNFSSAFAISYVFPCHWLRTTMPNCRESNCFIMSFGNSMVAYTYNQLPKRQKTLHTHNDLTRHRWSPKTKNSLSHGHTRSTGDERQTGKFIQHQPDA